MGLFDDLIGAAKKAAGNEGKDAGKDLSAELKSARIVFSSLPETLDAMKALPQAALTDPFATAALAVTSLCVYPKNREAAHAMINFLRGPRPMSPLDEAFLRDRFMDGKDYVPRSYFDGATPENNYTPIAPFTVTVKEGAHSRDQEKDGYLTLYLTSGGADSPRPVTLRNKPSTGQWFLWDYPGLLASIRIPKSEDVWA